MCRPEREGGRRCANANASRSYRTSLTERLARNKRVLDKSDLDDKRRATLEHLIARDEYMTGVLADLISEYGEVVTKNRDDTQPLHAQLATKLPGSTLSSPAAPLPTFDPGARNRDELRKFARKAGTITAHVDGAIYVRTPEGTHVRLVNDKARPVFTSDGVRVNLLGMVVDSDHAVDSHPDTTPLYLHALNPDRLLGDADASLRGIAQTSQRVRGVHKDTMAALRSNADIIADASDRQKRRTWLDIANGDRPDRAFANLRLAHLEGAYPGLADINTADFRRGARSLADTMRRANVQPTMRAEMLAGYYASQEPSFARKEQIINSLIKDDEGRKRALFFSNTSADSYATHEPQVRELAEYASTIGTSIRERCYVAAATGDERSASLLDSAIAHGYADGPARDGQALRTEADRQLLSA